jgi:hypothetical protein
MTALVETGALDGGDGGHQPESARTDRLSSPGHDVGYKPTERGAASSATSASTSLPCGPGGGR